MIFSSGFNYACVVVTLFTGRVSAFLLICLVSVLPFKDCESFGFCMHLFMALWIFLSGISVWNGINGYELVMGILK